MELGYQPSKAVIPLNNPIPNTIPGGKADKYSIQDIATKHGESLDNIVAQLKKGILIELEHTTDQTKALEIAMDHLIELPDYYDRLVKMEQDAEVEQ